MSRRREHGSSKLEIIESERLRFVEYESKEFLDTLQEQLEQSRNSFRDNLRQRIDRWLELQTPQDRPDAEMLIQRRFRHLYM
jgi:hypothetical protein